MFWSLEEVVGKKEERRKKRKEERYSCGGQKRGKKERKKRRNSMDEKKKYEKKIKNKKLKLRNTITVVGTNCIRYSNHAGRGQAQCLISYVRAV